MEELDNSIEDFMKACELKKDDPYPHFNLGINYLLGGNFDSALESLTNAIELNKFEPQFYNYKALTLYMMGQYEQSLFIFSEAIKIYELKNMNSPEVAECWFNRGNTLLNIGK